MKECGYRITAEFLRDHVQSTPNDKSPVGLMMDSNSLAHLYERIGLTIKRQRPTNEEGSEGTGGVSPIACKICGDLKDQPWYRKRVDHLECDPDKHRAYYDAF